MFGFAIRAALKPVTGPAFVCRERHTHARERYWTNRAKRDALKARLDEQAKMLEAALQARGLKVDVLG